ncbi:hypothetical protein TNCV_906471 [Trichonephila clavipes]|nr:hypothetical protein TNCV_906471 [Trichonephila clavipes]
MVLKANDRRTSCPCHDEFRGPRSDYIRQPTPSPFDLSTKECHKPDPVPQTTIPGKCLSSPEDEQESPWARIRLLHAEIVEVEIEVVSPSIVPSGNFAELNRTVTCRVLKTNDRRTSCPRHDEFRGPRSD